MAFHEHGHTYGGTHAAEAAEAVRQAGADIVGANCGRGVRAVLGAVKCLTSAEEGLVSAFPNAGLPEYVDGRYLFGAPLPYLVESAAEMVAHGVCLIGGCCGTTPAYVERIARQLKGPRPARPRVVVSTPPPRASVAGTPVQGRPPAGSIFDGWLQDAPQRPLVVVELDPPRGLDYEQILQRARQLRDMAVDAITMADNPVASVRMGNVALAQIVQDEIGIPVIVHLTCRDHNLLGLQSLLMAAHVMGLHHLLALTGDPTRVGDQPGATSVYDLNSFGLIELIRKFNDGVNHMGMPLGKNARFTTGVAFNPNARNLAGQVARLRKKLTCGAHFAMTQPIYEVERFEQMREATAGLVAPILVGCMPVQSERNAEFLHNEVPGIALSEEVRRRMKGLTGPAGRREGIKICKELIDQMVGKADGFYIIPPQTRTEMAVELVDHVHELVPRGQ
jgi:homocysteine S-methyltransferase